MRKKNVHGVVDVVLCPYIKDIWVAISWERQEAAGVQHPTVSLLCILLDVTRYQCTILSGYEHGFDILHSLEQWVSGHGGNRGLQFDLQLGLSLINWSRTLHDYPLIPLVSEATKWGSAVGFRSVRRFLMILYEMWNVHLKQKWK